MIDESDAAAQDPLFWVRTELMKLYEDTTASPQSIESLVRKVETEHKSTLGHLAEFWLLLSVGEVLAHPTQTYGHYAGAHRRNAKKCDDVSSEVVLKHGELISNLLPMRSGRSNVRAHVAAIWAQRPYNDLARELEHAV